MIESTYPSSPLLSTQPSVSFCEKSIHIFRGKIQYFSENTALLWDTFKERLLFNSESLIYLENLNRQTINWNKESQKLAELIAKTPPYTLAGLQLKRLLSTCPVEQLTPILYGALEQLLSLERGSFETIVKFLGKKKMRELCENENTSFVKKLQELKDCLPSSSLNPLPSFWSRLAKTLRVVVRFFPRFMDTLLKAFNLMEIGRAPETPWDFHAVLSIYFKLFLVPYAVFLSIGAFVSIPAHALLLTAAALLLMVTSVCLYIRHRPIPQELPRAKNLSEEVREEWDPFIGRELEISQLLGYVNNNENSKCSHILLTGKSGAGKTELVKEVVRRCNKKVFFIINTPLFVDGFTPLDDKIGLLLQDLKGHERKVVLVFEEFGDAVHKKQKNIGGCLKSLMDKHTIQIIALATEEEHLAIKEDSHLHDRFTPVHIEPANEKETLKILQEHIYKHSDTLFFEDDLALSVYKKTEKLVQPRAAVKLLNKAIQSLPSQDEHVLPPEIAKNEVLLKQHRREYKIALISQQNTETLSKKIQEILQEIEKQKEAHRNVIRKIQRLQKLFLWRRQSCEQLHHLQQKKSAEKTFFFLQKVLWPWIQQELEKMKNEKDILSYKIDSKLLDRI